MDVRARKDNLFIMCFRDRQAMDFQVV